MYAGNCGSTFSKAAQHTSGNGKFTAIFEICKQKHTRRRNFLPLLASYPVLVEVKCATDILNYWYQSKQSK